MASTNDKAKLVAERKAAEAQKTRKGRILGKLDDFIQRHKFLSLPYSVQKKYSDDQAGYQAALVTYYGFLSLFPLLIVAMSLTQLSLLHSAHLKAKIITALNKNFPIVGSQLQNSVHSNHKAGIALIISVLITIYGARGVAQAFQSVMNHIWQVPMYKRGGLINNLKSIILVIFLGVGFIVSGVLSSYFTAPHSNIWLRIAAFIVSLLLLTLILMVVFKLSLSIRRKLREFFSGALTAAIGFQIVQAVGGFLITHELKKLSSLYGTFAVILATLFWIYLLARIILYATEIDTVLDLKLWPRSLTAYRLTPADQRALKMYAGRGRYEGPKTEKMSVNFP